MEHAGVKPDYSAEDAKLTSNMAGLTMEDAAQPSNVALAQDSGDEVYSVHSEDDRDGEEGEGDESENYPACAQCGRAVKNKNAPRTINGPLHPGCVMEYRFLHQPRCHYCDIRFTDREATAFVKDPETGFLYHTECAHLEHSGVPFTRPTLEGYVRKQAVARSKLSPKNWKVRYFVLSPEYGGIRYYESDPTGKNKPPRDLGKSGNKEQAEDDAEGDNEYSDSSSSSSEDEAQRKAKEAKLTKGQVLLDRRTRLISNPSLSLYKGSTSAADSTPAHSELAIIFYDSPDSKKERRLLFQCKDPKERYTWMRALEAYIHTVDDPSDYKKKAGPEADEHVTH